MDTEKCCECKGPLPEELPHSIIVCSDNCWNKFHWKIYRSQLLFIGVFGLILIWVFGSAGNILGVALFSAITTALVMLKYMQMEKYSFSENEIQERLDEIKREQLGQKLKESKLEKQKINPTEIKESQNTEVRQPKPSGGIEKKKSREESNDSNSTLDLKTRASNLRKGLDELRKSL